MFKKRSQKGQAKRAAPDAVDAEAPQAAIVQRPQKQARGQRFATKGDERDEDDRLQASAVFASSRTTVLFLAAVGGATIGRPPRSIFVTYCHHRGANMRDAFRSLGQSTG